MIDSPHLYLRERPPHKPIEAARRTLEISTELRRRRMPAVVSLRHLSLRSRVDYAFLHAVVTRGVDGYDLFEVRRRNGKPRTIAAPQAELVRVQRWILDRMLHRVEPHADSWAYFPGRSAVQAARRHTGAEWLIKLDLKNFFHQVDERMVFRLFEFFGYPKLLAFEMARISTRQAPQTSQSWLPDKYFGATPRLRQGTPYNHLTQLGYLPQGAPTSGAIANLAARQLDESLSQWAASQHMVYTRYSDDIVLSGSADTYSRASAKQKFGTLRSLVENHGWEPNPAKGRIVPPGSRLIVLGMLVDGDRVRLRREMRQRIGEHLRGIERFGVANHAAHRHFRDAFGMLNHVRGLVDHARSVDPDQAAEFDARLRPYEI